MKNTFLAMLMLFLTACSVPAQTSFGMPAFLPAATHQHPRPYSNQPKPSAGLWKVGSRSRIFPFNYLTNLKASAIPFESACSEANNEICLAADGNLVRFSARETDFFVRLSVAELQDETALDSLLEKTLSIIDQFPTEQTPGPNTGYVGITFRLAGNVQNLWFTQTQANDLRVKGLKGASLYRALKITP